MDKIQLTEKQAVEIWSKIPDLIGQSKTLQSWKQAGYIIDDKCEDEEQEKKDTPKDIATLNDFIDYEDIRDKLNELIEAVNEIRRGQ
jgi:hypothetical protein